MKNLNFYYYLIAAIFLATLVFYNWLKQKDYRKIIARFKEEDILLKTFGVKYFGKESEKGKILNSEGFMVLLKDGLFYRGSFDKKELFIPKGKIFSIAITDHHKGEILERECLAFYFENENGELDRAAFSIPHPEIWVKEIKKNLVLDRFFSIRREIISENNLY
ncbi:MAG: hypothetical protein H5U37_00350 [Caldisericia bacterium]|nr:hypothetical protein [Caldisericia bacterium]